MTTYYDMFSDFRSNIVLYVERLDVTPLMFMRLVTTGLSKFQRDTNILNASVKITRSNVDATYFDIPTNILKIRMVQDHNGVTIAPSSPEQFQRIREQNTKGVPDILSDPARFRCVPEARYRHRREGRTYSLFRQKLALHPDGGDTELTLLYVPHLEPFTYKSDQWAAFTAEDSIESTMSDTGVPDEFQPYAPALVCYATAMYLRQQRTRDYVVYEKDFEKEVAKARDQKPVLARHLHPLYRI